MGSGDQLWGCVKRLTKAKGKGSREATTMVRSCPVRRKTTEKAIHWLTVVNLRTETLQNNETDVSRAIRSGCTTQEVPLRETFPTPTKHQDKGAGRIGRHQVQFSKERWKDECTAHGAAWKQPLNYKVTTKYQQNEPGTWECQQPSTHRNCHFS